MLVLARHAQTLLVGPDYHGWPSFADVARVSNGRLVLPGLFFLDFGRSSVFEQGIE